MLLHDFFDYTARARGHLTFATFADTSVTYAGAHERALRMAAAAQAAGLAPGDRLVYIGPNSIDHALVYFAMSMCGVVTVPVNPRLTPAEVDYIVEDSGARVVVTDDGVDSWLDGVPTAPVPHRAEPSDVVYQMYTSGTTGRPKGVLLTHAAVLANCAQASAGLHYAIEPGDRWQIVAPLFHAAAVITAFSCVNGGGCLAIQRGFDPAAVVAVLADDDIALTTLVPAMIKACLAVEGVERRTYPALRAMAYGGSAIDEATLRRAMAVFGCDFYQGFGQTESSAGLTYLTELDHRRALDGRPELLASCGRAMPGSEIRVVDPDGNDMPTGETGEIIARGPQLMVGYWNQPDATAATLREGWLWTGDAGSLDAEGYLTIRDRLRDVVVSGGENVYPREVEEALLAHDDVLDAAVIGVPDETWGEAVFAVLVARPGVSLDIESVLASCRERIAGFKVPKAACVIDELPRNASGKVLKHVLREPYWAGASRNVS